MKNHRFALNKDCSLVRGAKRGAIYDLSSGDVYSINGVAAKVLEECEEGLSLREVAQFIPELNLEEILRYLTQLESSRLVSF